VTRVRQAISVVMLLLGIAIIAVTLANGGGPIANGILFGGLFILAGAGRLWAERARD
jgi:hypothetical protein